MHGGTGISGPSTSTRRDPTRTSAARGIAGGGVHQFEKPTRTVAAQPAGTNTIGAGDDDFATSNSLPVLSRSSNPGFPSSRQSKPLRLSTARFAYEVPSAP